jgi:type VI protein secretion system component Hcp
VTSFDVKAKNEPTTAGGGGGGAKVEFGAVRFTKPADATTPKLLVRTASGQHLASATFNLGELAYKLTDVTVVGFEQGDEETVELSFGTIRVTHQPSGATGGWDVKLNRSI